uniref:hypothetical protein n=1 Tax=Cupriavidus necator TaxID=106590 RepID=UPI003F499B23
MRLTVIHDSNGNIVSMVAYPEGSPPMYPETKPGQHMTEMEAPANIRLDLDARQLHERLSEVMQNYRVDMGSMKCSLTRKS